MNGLIAIFAVIISTWNGNWFPSGRAEHRAHPEVEAATISAAGKLFTKGLARIDPEGTNDLVIVVNEVRGPQVAAALAKAIGRTNLNVAVVSGYRRRDRFDYQQDVILTTLPVAAAHWSLWKSKGKIVPPRGYAYAELIVTPAVTARVYAVHLKSNYRANTDEKREKCRLQRTLAVEQLCEQERPRRGRKSVPVVVAGDFNADPARREFAAETFFTTLGESGFTNVLERLAPDERGTHPHRRYGNSSLDAIYLRGAEVEGLPIIIPSEELSDHMPVFAEVKFDAE